MLESLDVRQMVGQPAWFGSTGFDGFAGIGQATLGSLVHELGHSYWGAFPVTGRPDLSWEAPPGGISPALAQYRKDLETFMFQPPDPYEPLRDRFRNLPNLAKGTYPDLFHFGEADMVNLVGGNLNLVPPILRKYFDQFLQPEEFQTWDEALGWYLSLPGEERGLANAYLGFTHIPLKQYEALKQDKKTFVFASTVNLLQREERQRLIDFAQQFDLITTSEDSLLDAANIDRGFPFWRGFLREMFRFQKKHPNVLTQESGAVEGPRIAQAFDILAEMEGLPSEDKVPFLQSRLQEDPFLYNFVPILDNRLLVTLFEKAEAIPPEAKRKGTGAFLEQLRQFIVRVDSILALGKAIDPKEGARALEQYITELESQGRGKAKQDLDTILELFLDTDRETTKKITEQLGDEAIRKLLNINPARTRFLLDPPRLLKALKITLEANADDMAQGIFQLVDNSSGNFAIDEPFLEEVYVRVGERGDERPKEALEIVATSALPLPRFILGHGTEAVNILSADLELTLALFSDPDPYRVTTPRLIYHLIFMEPSFAALIVDEFSERGDDTVVMESLIYFAYDFDRLQTNPELPTSLLNDGLFLSQLVLTRGGPWLREHMEEAITKYRDAARSGEVEADFIDAYRRTLKAVLEEDLPAKLLLTRAIRGAFENLGLRF